MNETELKMVEIMRAHYKQYAEEYLVKIGQSQEWTFQNFLN
jgi:hypothetical protein